MSSSPPIDKVDPIPTAPVNVEIPVVNTFPSGLSVTPEPTFTSEVTSKSLLIPTVPLGLVIVAPPTLTSPLNVAVPHSLKKMSW